MPAVRAGRGGRSGGRRAGGHFVTCRLGGLFPFNLEHTPTRSIARYARSCHPSSSQPRQHLPMRQPQTCMPCNQNQPVADPEVRVTCVRLPRCPGLTRLRVPRRRMVPCRELQGVQHKHNPGSPVAGGDLYVNNDGAFAGGRASG